MTRERSGGTSRPGSAGLARGRLTKLLGLGGEMPPRAVRQAFAGVGMIRGEYILRGCCHYLGTDVAASALTSYLTAVAEAFAPSPVWYRTADLESREINVLVGADAIVWDENPLLGARGVRRSVLHPQAFEIELALFGAVARDNSNLHLLLPYVGTVEEVRFATRLARSAGYKGKIGVMMEVPAAAMVASAILAEDVEHVTIGFNDLRSLLYGVARASAPSGFPGPISRLVEEVQLAAASQRCSVHGAGYLTADDVAWLHAKGLDGVVIHYHQVPELMGTCFEQQREHFGATFRAVKAWTDEALQTAEARDPTPGSAGPR